MRRAALPCHASASAVLVCDLTRPRPHADRSAGVAVVSFLPECRENGPVSELRVELADGPVVAADEQFGRGGSLPDESFLGDAGETVGGHPGRRIVISTTVRRHPSGSCASRRTTLSRTVSWQPHS